ncbi:MAG: AAA family ATPase, partial [Sporichthyaceae bacterium]
AACLATRPAKPAAVPEQSLRDRWATTARAAGHHPAKVIAAVLRRHRAPVPPSAGQLAAHLLGPSGLTAQATGFDRRDLLQALCQCLPAGTATDRARVEAIADQVLASRDVVRLAAPVDDGARWSTTELLAVEQHALRTASQLQAVPDREIPPDQATETLTGRLSGEQQAMVRALTAADGLAVVVGPAGAGKTAALAAAVQVWAGQGRPVTGAAVAAVTARRLEHATGAPSTSLTWLLHTVRRMNPATRGETGLLPGSVLVVDEASMVDTRTLAMLLHHTRQAHATLVLVGDPAQLPEIGAGGLFAALTQHPATITLTDNRRQTEAWERRALSDLRAGDPDAAVAAYADHQRVHTAPADQLPDRIVEDYLRLRDEPMATDTARDEAGERVVMLAVRRSDVTKLNATARRRLLEDGRLGLDAVVAGGGHRAREYRAADQVLVTANDHRLGLLNGTRGTVTGVDPQAQTLTVRDDEDRQATVTADWAAGHLDHGYAMTCHKAQGATVETALLYGSGALTREAGYVALSRGRTANHLYVTERDDTQPAAWIEDDEHLDRLAANLAVRRAQTLASRQLPAAECERWRPPTSTAPYRQAEGISR